MPGSRVPQDLVDILCEHKGEIMAYLREHPERLHRNSTELDDTLRRVDEGGYVLLWSILLGDLIACYKT